MHNKSYKYMLENIFYLKNSTAIRRLNEIEFCGMINCAKLKQYAALINTFS